MPRPVVQLPAGAARCLRFLLPPEEFEYLVGYYEQGFQNLALRRGRPAGGRWLWRQIVKAAPALIGLRLQGEGIMWQNYLATTLRLLRRRKGFSAINIAGLAAGLACCLIIFVWIRYETSTDRQFAQAESIHQVVIRWREGDRTQWARVTPPALAAALAADFPEVRRAVSFAVESRVLVQSGDVRFNEKVGFAGPGFLSIFNLPLIQGDPRTALSDPSALVIDRTTALKYFGTEACLGRTLTLNKKGDGRVAGVMGDIRSDSALHCSILASFSQLVPLFDRGHPENWGEYGFGTFILLDAQADRAAFQARLQKYLFEKKEEDNIVLETQPLTHIRLHALGGGGGIVVVRIFSVVAAFILLIAGVNFVNLTTARSSHRLREIGVRKVVGADRLMLIQQFLGESVLTAFLAALAAWFLARAFLPALRRLADIPAGTPLLEPWMLPFFGLFALGTGLAAGLYPAFVLSSFRPSSFLRGRGRSGSPLFRKILVVFQFAVAVTLLVCTWQASRQIDYLGRAPLGFDKEHVVYVPLNPELSGQTEPIRRELLQHPGILQLTGTSNYLGEGPKWSTESVAWEGKNPDDKFNLYMISVDPEFIETFRVSLAGGRFFDRRMVGDGQNFILNETAVKAMGLAAPLGKGLKIHERAGTVIGIVKDFNFRPLHREVQPLALVADPAWHNFLAVKIDAAGVPASLDHIEKTFKRFAPSYVFEYRFLDEALDASYRTEAKFRTMFRYFVFLAGLISGLGLLGLTSFVVEKRTREIGLRKVLGASTTGVAALLSRDLTRWVLTANVIAWPVSYLLLRQWLRLYAYRAPIGWDVFLLSGAAVLVLALAAVGTQSVKAALADPVDALRVE